MSQDDVHLPEHAHGSHMTTPPESRRDETDPLRSRPNAPIDDVDLDPGGLDRAALELFFAEWSHAAARPPRVDASLAAILEHGLQRRPEVVREVAVDDELIGVATVIDLDEVRSRRGRARRIVARGAVVGLASITVSSGLAAAGVLPSPVQRAVSNAADVVGIHIEQPERPVLGPIVDDTTTTSQTQVLPRRPERTSTEASVATIPTQVGEPSESGSKNRSADQGDATPTTAATNPTKPDRPAPSTTVAPTNQCPAGEVRTNSPDEPDGCRPCRTHDPETGEVIPNWRLPHNCRPCPTDRDSKRDRNGKRDRDGKRDRERVGEDSGDSSLQRDGAIGTRRTMRPLRHCSPTFRERRDGDG